MKTKFHKKILNDHSVQISNIYNQFSRVHMKMPNRIQVCEYKQT